MAVFLRPSCNRYGFGLISSRGRSISTFHHLQKYNCVVPTHSTTHQRCLKSVFPLCVKTSFHTNCLSQQKDVSHKHEVGSSHWKMFRYLSVIMIGVYPAAILAPTPVIDWAIAITFPLHSYWGTKEVISDYIPQLFSTKSITTAAVYAWAGISILTFFGLAYLNIYDVGVCKAVAMLWKL